MKKHGICWICAILVLTLVLVSAAAKQIRNIRSIERTVKFGLTESIQNHISALAIIGNKMTYAGADVRNTLLPQAQNHLYLLKELNSACIRSFGESHAPVTSAYITRAQNACSYLEKAYATGGDTNTYEKALAVNLLEFRFFENTTGR